ncbi:MAG: HAMP domain-containing sensor histidine kinase [Vicinamibacterales bacterium]
MNWLLQLSARARRTLLASAIVLSGLILVLIGYRAVVEWRHAATLVASRRATSAVELLVSALAHDMRGAHTTVLVNAQRDSLAAGSAANLLHPIAGAFTRYPYAEAFFSWRNQPEEDVVFYSRVDRRPAWLTSTATTAPYPVATGADRVIGRLLLQRLLDDTHQGRRFSAFTTTIGSTDYQVAAEISYADETREQPTGFIGYVVNLAWVREHYFADLVAQVARIEGSDNSVTFTITDDAGRAVVGTPTEGGPDVPLASRTFQLAFFEPAAVAVDPPPDLGQIWWTAVATASGDPTLAAAERGARRTLAIAGVMSLMLAGAVIVALRAARTNSDLAIMRADFVSAVTHELKTPLANLRAINETLASGRSTPEMVREYAHMGIGEATRLTRLVDNLLAYSRVTDVADVYSFEPVSLADAVERSLQEFAVALRRDGFAVHVDVSDELPNVYADANALGLLLNNLIDNAVRYSKDVRELWLTGRAHDGAVTIEVRDRGVGIPADELDNVTRKFFRGRGAVSGGSGLGLAIVDRIVSDHDGTLAIRSQEGQGTTVSVTMPAAQS